MRPTPLKVGRVTSVRDVGNTEANGQSNGMKAQSSKEQSEKYHLRLYVTGSTPKSIRAITNIKRICETHLKGRYILEVVDIYQQPGLAKGEQIIAAPTLIKKLPLPLRKFIGDMTNTDRILIGLDLPPA